MHGSPSARIALASTLLAIVLTVFAQMPARAAVDIRQLGTDPAGIVTLVVSGAIEPGDAQRIEMAFSSLPATVVRVARMEAAGGALDEALRIGRFFYAARIRTEVIGRDKSCIGPCALAFLGGRGGDGSASRTKGSDARLGLHAFRRIVPDREFTVADMQEAVAATQRALLALVDYLTSVGADIELLALMLDRPHSEITYVSNEQALRLGLQVIEERTGGLAAPFAATR